MNPYDIVGKIYKNNEGYKFKVKEYQGFNKHNQRIYSIEFLDSHYIKDNVQRRNLLDGKIKDRFAKSIVGVGFLGNAKKSDNIQIYNLWVDMIYRCYSTTCPAYAYYGEQGVSVCERWHCLEWFTEDIPLIEGYNEALFLKGVLKLDKDYHQQNINIANKIYSLDTCCFVSHYSNMQEATERYNTTKSIKYAILPNGEHILIRNLTKFCKKHNLNYRNVYYVLEGKLTHTQNYQFYYKKSND